MPLIKLEVTPDIAQKIRFLAESGVFAITTGSATLHFKDMELKSIKTEVFSYPDSQVLLKSPVLVGN